MSTHDIFRGTRMVVVFPSQPITEWQFSLAIYKEGMKKGPPSQTPNQPSNYNKLETRV